LQESELRHKAFYHDNPLIPLTVNKNFIIEATNGYGLSLLGYEPDGHYQIKAHSATTPG